MSHAVELVADGLVDAGVAVAVDVGPQRGHAVEVAAALGVDEVDAVGAIDDQRGTVGLPLVVLGEGVPEVLEIPGGERLGRGVGGG